MCSNYLKNLKKLVEFPKLNIEILKFIFRCTYDSPKMHPKILLLLFTFLSIQVIIRNSVIAVKPPGYVEPVKIPDNVSS